MSTKPYRPGGSLARRAAFQKLVDKWGEPQATPEGYSWNGRDHRATKKGHAYARGRHVYYHVCLWCGRSEGHSGTCPVERNP
jgi:hypothetical protein